MVSHLTLTRHSHVAVAASEQVFSIQDILQINFFASLVVSVARVRVLKMWAIAEQGEGDLPLI
jgi:hypothetical protein